MVARRARGGGGGGGGGRAGGRAGGRNDDCVAARTARAPPAPCASPSPGQAAASPPPIGHRRPSRPAHRARRALHAQVDVDLFFKEELTIGKKIKLCENLITALRSMRCPHILQAHQIQVRGAAAPALRARCRVPLATRARGA